MANGYGQAANAFAQGFMGAFNAGRDRSLQNQQLEAMKAYRDAMIGQQQAQTDLARSKLEQEQTNMRSRQLGALYAIKFPGKVLSGNIDQEYIPHIGSMKPDELKGILELTPAGRDFFQKQDDPSSVKEYQFAVKNGYNGSFYNFLTDQKRAGAPTINTGAGIQLGSIPPGYIAKRTTDGGIMMEAIQGSPAAESERAAKEKIAKVGSQAALTSDIVTSDIDRIDKMISGSDIPVTGIFSAVSSIPGTRAHDVSKLLDSVRSNISFDKLQAMRAASPTGGALGQVSDFENRLLQSTLGSLEQTQSTKQFRQNLQRVKKLYSKIVNEGVKPTDSLDFLNQGGTEESDPLGLR